MGAVLIDLGRRNLAVAVVGALVLNVAYVFETPLLHSSGHLEAIALLCVTVIVVAIASRRPEAASLEMEVRGTRSADTLIARRCLSVAAHHPTSWQAQLRQ